MQALWPHQINALHFIADKPAAMLAMVMRSGKSRVAVEHLERLQARRVLIVCPKSVVDVWPDQFCKYGQREWPVLPLRWPSTARKQKEADEFTRRGEGVVIVNHDAFWRHPFGGWALQQPWDAVVMDESHHLKAPGGKASRYAAMLGRKVRHKLALTGTPFHHSPLDIYGQYRALDPAIYGTNFHQFKHRYANWIPITTYEMLDPRHPWKNQEELQEKFYRIAFRVGPEVLNLPESLHMVRECQLSPAAQKVYKALEKEFYAEVASGEITVANAAVKGLRLQQLTSGYGKLADSGQEVMLDESKAGLLEELLDDLDEPVVVYCRFHHDLDAVHKAAVKVGKESLELSGRRSSLKEWQQGAVPILAVQVHAGGEGVDLSRAKVAIYYSLGLSLGDHDQSQYRFLQKDQQHSMAYYYLLAENTVDWKVYNALRTGKDVIQALLTK